ncbi:hypothetical protein B0H12DRAFT_81049 [Mycena haematopus]|nr:hypothetical protein B0H12DRAFT_81049 [Mycena haematopus]
MNGSMFKPFSNGISFFRYVSPNVLVLLILHLGFDNIMATAYATVQSIARMRQHSDSRHRTCCTSPSLCRLLRRRLRGFVWDVRKMASRYEGTLDAMLWRSL